LIFRLSGKYIIFILCSFLMLVQFNADMQLSFYPLYKFFFCPFRNKE
jgi:hypothetical protein